MNDNIIFLNINCFNCHGGNCSWFACQKYLTRVRNVKGGLHSARVVGHKGFEVLKFNEKTTQQFKFKTAQQDDGF